MSEEHGVSDLGDTGADMDRVDPDLDAELGFGSVVSATGASDRDDTRTTENTHRTSGSETADDHVVRASGRRLLRGRRPAAKPGRSRLRRKLSATAVLFGALLAVGGSYAAFASSSSAAGSSDINASINQGRQLYAVTCIACHGSNLQGVTGRGPSLVGVGSANVYFQVITGRMPAQGQGAYISRKDPKYSDEQTRAIAAYVQSVGGGPSIPTGQLRGGNNTLGEGGELFSVNCASCHGITGKGAPLSAGKVAPSLNDATDLEIWTAMLSGPESMPVFGDNQITPSEKQAIIAYIQTIKASADPGGSGVGRIGPVSEAIVIWVVGVGLLMGAILWIGARVK